MVGILVLVHTQNARNRNRKPRLPFRNAVQAFTEEDDDDSFEEVHQMMTGGRVEGEKKVFIFDAGSGAAEVGLNGSPKHVLKRNEDAARQLSYLGIFQFVNGIAALDRIWHMQDSRGQILAWASWSHQFGGTGLCFGPNLTNSYSKYSVSTWERLVNASKAGRER